jgi:hypothetical protein
VFGVGHRHILRPRGSVDLFWPKHLAEYYGKSS